MKEEILYSIRLLDKASEPLKKIESNLRKLGTSSGFASFKANIDNMNRGINKVSSSFASAGLKASIFLGIATKKLYDFEFQMNTIQAVSGLTAEQLGLFRKKAIELGATTQYTSSEVAGLGIVFAKMGKSVDETMSLLKPALEMATAGGIGLEESATLLGRTMTTFNIPLEEASRTTDTLAKGANIASMGIMDFEQLISKVGPTASLTGMKLDSLVAMFGALRDKGLQAEVAATGLGSSMARMVSDSKEVTDSLARLGINQQKFMLLPFEKKLEVLNKGFSKIKDSQMQLAIGTDLFGMEHAKTMISLVLDIDKYKDKLKQLQDAQGYTAKNQEIMMQGLVGAYKLFTSALDGVIFGMGESSEKSEGLTKKLEKMFNIGTKILTMFNNLSPETKNWINNIVLLTASLMAFSLVLKVVAFTLGGLPAILKAIAIATKLWAFWQAILNIALGIANVLGVPLIAVFAGIIGALVAFSAVVYAIYQGIKYIYGIISDANYKKNKVQDLDSTEKIVKKSSTLSVDKLISNTKEKKDIPSGAIDVNINNNSKENSITASVLKQSNLKLGVQY